jgi:hypothetical protein
MAEANLSSPEVEFIHGRAGARKGSVLIATMKTNQLLGTVDEFTTLLQSNTTAFTAAGLTVGPIITDLSDKKDVVITQNDEQESFRRQCRDKTEQLAASAKALYDTFSTRIDAAMGAVGKKTTLGQQIARIRAGLRRNGSSNGNGESSSSSTPNP